MSHCLLLIGFVGVIVAILIATATGMLVGAIFAIINCVKVHRSLSCWER